MKRENTPANGRASNRSPSPGLILDSASVWQKREKDSPQQGETTVPKPAAWNRYADSRLKQFHCR